MDNTINIGEILSKHKLWINGDPNGSRADLRWADLSEADLRWANLRWANLSEADLSGADLRWANLSEANLSGADLSEADLSEADLRWANLRWADLRWANLSEANLSGADLRWANLSGADLDFSCLPLWCGSLSANFDDKQLKQLAYHLVKAGLNSDNASDETKEELRKIIDFANGFHRVDECGRIE